MKKFSLFSILVSIVCFFSYAGDGEIWKFAKTGTNAQIMQFMTDSVGNSYISGIFNTQNFTFDGKTVTGNTGAAYTNSFIMKLNSAGNLVFLYSVVGENDSSHISPVKMAVNNRGEMVVAFSCYNALRVLVNNTPYTVNGSHANLHLLVNVSKAGRLRWGHTVYSTYDPGYGTLELTDVILDEEGTCFAIGNFMGDAAFCDNQSTPGTIETYSPFFTRINSDGRVAWIESIERSVGTPSIKANIIREIGDHLYVAGTVDGSGEIKVGSDLIPTSSGIDALVTKYTKGGDPVWGIKFSGTAAEFVEDLVILNNENIVLMGVFNYDITIGSNYHYDGDDRYDIFLAQLNPDKTVVNSGSILTQISGFDETKDNAFMSTDRNNNIYVCTEFYGTTLFAGTARQISNTDGTSETSDILFAKYNNGSLAQPEWVMQGKGANNNKIESATLDNQGNIYIGGTTQNSLSIGDSSITGDAFDGTLYCAKLTEDGTMGYAYWHENFDGSTFNASGVSGDVYGNCFMTGTFVGANATLGEQDVSNTANSGIVIGKFARVRNITGTVQNEAGDPLTEGYVKLYGYTYFQNSPLNDSVLITAGGNFSFSDIPNGNYLAVAVPQGSEAGAYIATYYPSARYWELGQRLPIRPGEEPTPITITMIETSELVGGTEFNGNVSEEDTKKSVTSKSLSKGKPETEATVVLAGNRRFEKTTYDIVATATTDASGNFAFYNIENGGYYLWVDMPGLPSDVHEVTVNNNQLISNINYITTEEMIVPVGAVTYTSLLNNGPESGVMIYPNPAKEFITISISDFTSGIVDLYNTNGQHTKHMELKHAETLLSVTNLKPGSYYMRIMTESKLIFEKITVIE